MYLYFDSGSLLLSIRLVEILNVKLFYVIKIFLYSECNISPVNIILKVLLQETYNLLILKLCSMKNFNIKCIARCIRNNVSRSAWKFSILVNYVKACHDRQLVESTYDFQRSKQYLILQVALACS